MTKVDLRLKYKQETGTTLINEYNANYTRSRPKNANNWFTDDYVEWLEEKFLELINQIEEIPI